MPPGIKDRLRGPYTCMLELETRWSRRRVGLALTYHRIGDPQEDRERHLVPALGSGLFEEQMRHLKARYRPVPASGLLDAVRERRPGERVPVAVTFDDDLPSHVRIAMPILHRVDVPATFFVCGASLDGPFSFWWERLQLAFDREVQDALRALPSLSGEMAVTPEIHEVAAAIEPLPTAEKEEISRRLLEHIGADPPDAGLRAADLRALVEGGFEVGFHTRRHPVLPNVSDGELSDAMIDGRRDIESVVGAPLTVISYTHGKADRRVAEAARSAGYAFGFAGDPRAVHEGDDPLLIPRRYPSYAGADRFAIELARTLRAPN